MKYKGAAYILSEGGQIQSLGDPCRGEEALGQEGIFGEERVVSGMIYLVSDEEALVGLALIRCRIEPRLIVSSAFVGCLLTSFACWLGLIAFHLALCILLSAERRGRKCRRTDFCK